MVLQLVDEFGLERLAAPRGAEGAIARGAAGAAGDLREFRRREAAELVAVIFAVAGESDVIDIEIEAHADGVGGDEVIDIAGLKQLDLGISRARRKTSEHHGGAAVLALDEFGDGVNFIGGKRDNGGAARLPRDFAVAGEFQRGQPRTGYHVDSRE